MKYVAKNELLKTLMKENEALKAWQVKNRADMDYIAMMTDIDLDVEESESE